MKRYIRAWRIPLLLAIVFALGMTAGVALDRQVFGAFALPGTVPEAAEPQFARIAEAWNTIERAFVDRSEVGPEQLGNGAIRGMVGALGDTGHSRFLTAEQVGSWRDMLHGQLEGIGVEVEMQDNRLVVVAPIDSSPAQQAGVQPGDVILTVDGMDIAGMPLDEIRRRILGPAGTSVRLTILDPETETTRTLTLTRATIQLDNVTWQPIPGTCLADVRIAAFSQGVAEDLERSLAEIRQRELRGVVLDLRSNPGGFVDEAVGVASQFLTGGDVLLEQDAQGNVEHIAVRPVEQPYAGPLAVLVNAGTASSAEIVAGALQDHERAQVVGATTFGTGTVLNEFRLSDGSALLLATEKWLTPDGRVIWHNGIAPNIVVELPRDVTPLQPEDLRDKTPGQLQTSGDAQLLRAVELLSTAGAADGC